MERAAALFLTPMRTLAEQLAAAFLAGPWRLDDLTARGAAVLQRRPRWLAPMARRLMAEFGGNGPLRLAELAAKIEADFAFERACQREEIGATTVIWDVRPEMRPAKPATGWNLPAMLTPGDLAAWLGLSGGELQWFADRQGREFKLPPGPLRHYRYRWLARRRGPPRLIETPKARLKDLQRRILRSLLDRIPPHDAVHGFRAGRSIRSYSAPHVGQCVVVRLDLEDFFASIRVARIEAMFLAAGYPEPVARLLAGLCTNRAPSDVWDSAAALFSRPEQRLSSERRYQELHLPQGAPTSPALANLTAYRLDCRLAGLARAAEAQYSRYADDLAFSGGREFERSLARFVSQAAAIAIEEGFRVQHRKTRVMRQGVRQCLAGVVINKRANVARDDYERLKATLHNCVQFGSRGQNREERADFRAHLAERIAHVAMLNPVRGEKLKAVFSQIRWPSLT